MADSRPGGFRRRTVLIPVILGVLLVIGAYVLTEVRRHAGIALTEQMRDRQDRIARLAELAEAASVAESAQRGYLLTGDLRYLEPYSRAEVDARTLLHALQERYRQRDAAELPALQSVDELLTQKFTEMKRSIDLAGAQGGRQQALDVVMSGAGLRWMSTLRSQLDGIRERERQRFDAEVGRWYGAVDWLRFINAVNTMLTLILIVVSGTMFLRDMERRAALAQELDSKVAERTAELTALGDHSRRVIEQDRQRLARELHDELGGVLVGIKMDLAQLARNIDLDDPLLSRRWATIQASLNQGIELKRRVIEELRPTLLDNMGLAAALRWQAGELCQRAGLELRVDMPEEEPRLDPDLAIELFRVLQESLTNVVKHARASEVSVRLAVEGMSLLLVVEDNGVGIASAPSRSVGAHGLLGMRYRARSLGGTFEVGPAVPQGTRVAVRVPLASVEAGVAA
jgi:signal transduction histidine kinase